MCRIMRHLVIKLELLAPGEVFCISRHLARSLVKHSELLRSHHTNSFAHIIIKFKNKKVSLFLKNTALCSSLGGKYYRYIILLPI